MEKIIFCNLDILKNKPDEEDYEDYDFSNFDYELFRRKRDKFMRKFIELSEESNNKIFPLMATTSEQYTMNVY